MASSLTITCCVCEYEYNLEERKPLALPCGHTFCGSCLQEMKTRNNCLCPVCRDGWDGQSLDSFPIIRQLADSFEKITKIQSVTAKNICDHDDVVAWCNNCKVSSCIKCLRVDHRPCEWVSIEEKTNNLVEKLRASVASTETRLIENGLTISEIRDNIEQMQHYEKILQSFTKKLSIQQENAKIELEKYLNIQFNSSATELTKAISTTLTLLDESITAPKITNFVVPVREEPAAANNSEADLDGCMVRT